MSSFILQSATVAYFSTYAQCQILPEIVPLLKMCERSELVNISQLFHSFSQTRLQVVELSQAKPKLD